MTRSGMSDTTVPSGRKLGARAGWVDASLGCVLVVVGGRHRAEEADKRWVVCGSVWIRGLELEGI